MIFVRMSLAKKLFIPLVIVFCSLDSNPPTPRKRAGSKQTAINRKFNTAAFLHGIANSCSHAGNAVAAQTEQEKQQATCNMFASVFQTAAIITEKTPKRSVTTPDMLTPTIKTTITFLNTLSHEEKENLLAPHCAYLRVITALKNEKDQDQFIAQTLSHKEEGHTLISEIFSVFKTVLLDQTPEILNSMEIEVTRNFFDQAP